MNFTGADIDNIVNESSYIALRDGKKEIDFLSMKKAIDEFLLEEN